MFGSVNKASLPNLYFTGPCIIQRTNVLLALLMYASYFVLFAKLYRDHYGARRTDKKDA
jgi:hypothetical protein